MNAKKKPLEIYYNKSINNVIFIILFFSIITSPFSCKSQSFKATNGIHKDINGKMFLETIVKKNGKSTSVWVFDNNQKIIVPNIVDKSASLFENSLNLWKDFLEENLIWPKKIEYQGTILIALLINENGKVIDKRIVKTISECVECEKASLDLVNKLPNYKPALLRGHNVKSIQFVSIPFVTD